MCGVDARRGIGSLQLPLNIFVEVNEKRLALAPMSIAFSIKRVMPKLPSSAGVCWT
jgi:hypothetical protein